MLRCATLHTPINALRPSIFFKMRIAGDKQACKVLTEILEGEKKELSGALALPQGDLLNWQKQYFDMSLPAYLLKPDTLFELVIQRKGLVTDVLLSRGQYAAKSLTGDAAKDFADLGAIRAQLSKEWFGSGMSTKPDLIAMLEKKATNLERKLAKNADVNLIVDSLSSLTVDQVKKNLLPNQCLIELFCFRPIVRGELQDITYGALILGATSSEVTRITLGTVADIDQAIRLLRIAITSNNVNQFMKENAYIYAHVWEPILKALPKDANTLMICPDRNLSFLSFAALCSPSQRFVAEDFTIVYLSATRDLLRSSIKRGANTLTVLANPLFDKKGASQKASQTLTMRSGNPSVFGAITLPPLPGTENESRALRQVANEKGWMSEIFLGSEAMEQRIRTTKNPTVLHLATHGFYLNSFTPAPSGARGMSVVGEVGKSEGVSFNNGVDPMRASGLALTGAQQTFKEWSQGRSPDPKNDGVLTAEEIASLRLKGTWLVTLSACDTGLGEAQSGEGVFGLRRAFMMAGAENLLMTLWPVPDETTSKIMSDFYSEAFATNDATASLGKVQREWLAKIRNDKGIVESVSEAGAFAMVMMVNPNTKASANNLSSTDSINKNESSHDLKSEVKGSNASEDRVLDFADALQKADQGDAYAQAVVSIYFGIGYKTEKNVAKAAIYALKSASQKHPLGIYRVGNMRQNGEGMEKNDKQGRSLKISAFDGLNDMKNDPYALTSLGVMVFRGEGVRCDKAEAVRLYKTAADQGYAPAQYNYAACLISGQGIAKDEEKAKEYWQAAYQQKYPPALSGLPR